MLTSYVPSVFVHTNAVTLVMFAQIEECEKRVLRRRKRQKNDQDIGHTKRRCTAYAKELWVETDHIRVMTTKLIVMKLRISPCM